MTGRRNVTVIATPPVTDDARPKYVSPSSISTFEQCPLRYRYSRIDRLPEPSTEAQIGGSYAHEVLEALMLLPAEERTLARARTLVVEQWDAKWAAEIDEHLGLGDYDRHLLRWNVWNYVQNYFALEDPRSVVLEGVEARLEAEIDGVPVLGILDRWQFAPDGTAIISDYKTGKVARKPYDAEKRLQLMVYVTLHETLHDVAVSRAELIYLKGKGTRVSYEPTIEARTEMRETVTNVWAGIDAACTTGEFEARKSRLCDWCSFKSRCPAWEKY